MEGKGARAKLVIFGLTDELMERLGVEKKYGIRHDFVVAYGKDNTSLYAYEVLVFETEEQAAAYAEQQGATQDGTVAILISDADYFDMMGSFLPTFESYITMMVSMGMTKLD